MNNNETGTDLSLRKFIKDIGYIAGGTALLSMAPWLVSCTGEKLREIRGGQARIAVIGTGSRGQYHIHNLLNIPHARIAALCDDYAPNLDAASALVTFFHDMKPMSVMEADSCRSSRSW